MKNVAVVGSQWGDEGKGKVSFGSQVLAGCFCHLRQPGDDVRMLTGNILRATNVVRQVEEQRLRFLCLVKVGMRTGGCHREKYLPRTGPEGL